ncbi:TetR/AcrR family transcriptional regulator [Nocardioides sp. 616]|uniref:TetR/AcrR family transcriptional regulator n=1 Tax=Nocardioides sp. 616 TaxID=2268090 RepID=UPI000CE3D728|nr:TetR/AcrR family transcriptional regulator [Nocardioides sp. 616]
MTSLRTPGATRRQEFSAATKRALTDAAEELFTAHGYAATSLDAVVAGAQVTKGALYHHFTGKQDLFGAVFERVEDQSALAVAQAIAGVADPWEQALVGVRTFLAIVREPRYRRIVVQESPSVLGYEALRQQEDRSTYGTVVEIVRSTLFTGSWTIDEPMLHTFGRIFFGALNSAGASVSVSDDPEADSLRVEAVIGLMLAGIREIMESGADLESVTSSALWRADPA